jgi:hypothetical protein
MLIYAPNKNATGTWCSTQFKNGVGETNDPLLIKWFKEHGYKISEKPGEPKEVKAPVRQEEILDKVLEEQGEPNLEDMTPNELREWLKANGYGSKIKNIRDKEKLLNIARG